MIMMWNEFRTEWLRRLRSGEIEQGEGYLNRDGRMCCLGVACEVAIDQGVDFTRHENPVNRMMVMYGLPGTGYKAASSSIPNEAMCQKLGITEEGAARLAVFNDSGKSFKWIAAYIERYPHRVFADA